MPPWVRARSWWSTTRPTSPVGTGFLGRRLPGRPFDSRNLDLDAIREAAEAGAHGSLPAGVRAADLDVAAPYRGEVDIGRRGALLFVAQPLSPKNAGVPVLVATRRVAPFGRLGAGTISASVAAAVVAAAVSAGLVRHLTRPLDAMERAFLMSAGAMSGAVPARRAAEGGTPMVDTLNEWSSRSSDGSSRSSDGSSTSSPSGPSSVSSHPSSTKSSTAEESS